MKQKLYTLALAACASLFPAVASANIQEVSIFDNLKFTPNNKVEFMKESPEMMRAAAPQAPYITDANMTRTNYDYRFGYYFNVVPVQYSGILLKDNEIVQYIPEMDAVIFRSVGWDIKFDDKDQPEKGEVTIDLRVYKDNGVTLSDSLTAMTIEQDLPFWGHFKVINPDKANKNISKCTFLYYSNLMFAFDKGWRYGGQAAYLSQNGIMKSVSGLDRIKAAEGYDIEQFDFLGTYTQGNEIHFYSGADFDPKEDVTAPREKPHVLVGELANDELSAEALEVFQNEFMAPDPGLISKGKVVMDDYNGKIYYFTASPFADQTGDDKEFRTPAVTSSTDHGYSYSRNFEKMPKSVIFDFLKKNNIMPEGLLEIEVKAVLYSYRDIDFRVYGEDKMSAVTMLRLYNKSSNDAFIAEYMVEIVKDGANWSMNLIDDMTCKIWDSQTKNFRSSTMGTSALYLENEKPNDDPIPGKPFQLITSLTQRNRELELSLTKDNKYLVAKWIEARYDKKNNIEGKKYYDSSTVKTEPYTIYYSDRNNNLQPSEENSTYMNEIMVSYREIEGGKWSEPVPLTVGRGDQFYLHTSMPKVIPSINNIPLFYTAGIALNDDRLTDAMKNSDFWKVNLQTYKTLPDPVKKSTFVIGRDYHYGNFNVEAKEDVEETIIPNENGIGVFPNPATSEMTIKIDSQTSATVEVYNMVGAKVMSFNGVVSAVTANVSSLANGMYMIKVIENGNVRTSSFTIAR